MRNKKFEMLLDEIKKLHDRKNADYATKDDPMQNLKGCTRLGLAPITGVVIRMMDKWMRIENYYKNGELENESLRDSFIDNAKTYEYRSIYDILCISLE